MKNNFINLLPFLCEAFSINKTIYKDIDDLYYKNMYDNFKLAKSSDIYTHPICCEGSIEEEEYFKKTLGLLLSYKITDKEIMNLIKKGWPYVFAYFKNHKYINFSDFVKAFKHKFINKSNEISNDEILSNFLIVLCLGKKLNVLNYEDVFLKNILNTFAIRWDHYNVSNKYRFSISKIDKEDKKNINILKNHLNNKFGDIKKFIIFTNMYEYYVKLDNDNSYFISNLNFIFDIFDISITTFNSSSLNNDELKSVLYLFLLITNKENITELTNRDYMYLIVIMYFAFFLKSYKKAKEYHFNNNEEVLLLYKMQEKEKINNTLNEINNLKAQNESSLKIIKELENKISRLNSELEKQKENNTEIVALREFMFSCDNKVFKNIDDKLDLEKAKTLKGLIVGGHVQWQNKLKNYLPNFTFIHPSSINFDTNLLKNIDTIFFYTDYLNHSLYYKVINNIKNTSIKIKYLGYNTNIKIVLKEILSIYK